VKYARAVHHLREIAEAASEFLSFRDTTFGWPLDELWIAGELLKFPQELDVGSLVLRINLPANKLPWLGEQGDASWVAERLRLGKRPFLWVYRPSAWPAWNCRDRQVVRFWTAQQGKRDARALSVLEPTDQEFAQQLRSELAVSRRRLRDVLDHYEDRARRNRNSDYPTDEPLWRAAQGVREIEDALEPLNPD
jgi:hypothetical protein